MHEDYTPTPCPECRGDEREDWQDECPHCKGSGLMDPDGLVMYLAKPPHQQFPDCPRCGAKMARAGQDGEIWCRSCTPGGGYTKPFAELDVLRDPNILNRGD